MLTAIKPTTLSVLSIVKLEIFFPLPSIMPLNSLTGVHTIPPRSMSFKKKYLPFLEIDLISDGTET